MLPVDQDRFGVGEGNCLAACVASLTGFPLQELTDEIAMSEAGGGSHWYDRFITTMHARGYNVRHDSDDPPGYAIAFGPAIRGVHHAVVALDGKVVHDPHFSRAGLLEIQGFFILEPLSGNAD